LEATECLSIGDNEYFRTKIYDKRHGGLLDSNDETLMWTVHDIHENDYDCNTGDKGTGDTGTGNGKTKIWTNVGVRKVNQRRESSRKEKWEAWE
jgi:hypothetical protein